MKLAVLFPGQGSQFLGMGREFVDNDSDSQELLRQAEEACGLELGRMINEGPMEELTRNSNLQPAVTLTNLLCWRALQQALGDKKISCFAGHSLGEYSALAAAGVVSATDALKLVAKRGQLMEREGLVNPGGMRAVVGLSMKEVEEILSAYSGGGVVTAANHNTPQQVVISGDLVGLDGVGALVEKEGAKVIPLNVSVANHSPLMANAVPDFSEFLTTIDFHAPATPVYFNVSAAKCADPEEIKGIMARQIVSRVRWCEIITTMIQDGVDTFIEVGPKNVLKGMMRKIKPKGAKVTALQFDSPEGLTACLAKMGA